MKRERQRDSDRKRQKHTERDRDAKTELSIKLLVSKCLDIIDRPKQDYFGPQAASA